MRDPVEMLVGQNCEGSTAHSPHPPLWLLTCTASTRSFQNEEVDVVDANKANVGKMELQLKRWGAELDGLAEKANDAGTKAKADYRKLLEESKAKYDVARSQLAEFKTASSQKKTMMHNSIKRAWGAVEDAFVKLNK